MNFLSLFSILSYLSILVYSQDSELLTEDSLLGDLDEVGYFKIEDEKSLEESSKKFGKRLETIDGVEIASSYKEYINLALGDLDDRLRKSKNKLSDLEIRIEKRTKLFDQIIKEIDRRKALSVELTEKDRLIRDRLIRNTEMKSAIQNLADIAGYKLDKIKPNLKNSHILKKAKAELLLSEASGSLFNNIKNSSYTLYIGMAFTEVNEILAKDKQTIIELIRKKINNDFKIKELEKLRIKVSDSLIKLKDFEIKLNDLISHDSNVENVLRKVSNESAFDKEKILSILKNLSV